jgi:peptide/nickel transport system permease protein
VLFVLKRLLSLIPVSLGVIVVISSLIYLVPGDPVDIMMGPYASAAEKAAYRSAIGLDQPPQLQILNYIRRVLTGDLGTSMIYNRSVALLIKERIPATALLALSSMFVAILISLPLGVVSAVRRNSWVDYSLTSIAILGICVPTFFLGPLLVMFFAVDLEWFPVSEMTGVSSLVLPSLSLGIPLAAVLTRMTRTTMIEQLREDYVRTARAKGNSEFIVVMKHVLRNASIPLVTIIGLQFGVLLTGAIITERIFDWPGLGSLILEGINNRDYTLVQGCVLIFSASYLLVNLITDLLYSLLDPRIKLS